MIENPTEAYTLVTDLLYSLGKDPDLVKLVTAKNGGLLITEFAKNENGSRNVFEEIATFYPFEGTSND